MNTKKLSLFLFAILFISSAAVAQDANQDAQMQVWMDYMTPGEIHQAMASFAGDWKTESKMWMTPGAEPTVTQGTCKMEMILGGRYLKSTYAGDFMGMPFEGMSIEGFDNAAYMFYSMWIDNFGTGMMTMKGTYDDMTQSVNYKGTMMDPVQKKEIPVREVFHVGDPNKLVMEMFSEDNGQEFKNMEVTYTRP